MKNIQTFSNYSDLVTLSKKKQKPIIVSLESGGYTCLMCEVVETFLTENKNTFEFIKITGPTAEHIKSELSILKLPGMFILFDGEIKSIFQGLVAKHDIMKVLSELKT